MNWAAMGWMALILAGAAVVTGVWVYLVIERNMQHLAWFIGALFLACIIAVGVTA